MQFTCTALTRELPSTDGLTIPRKLASTRTTTIPTPRMLVHYGTMTMPSNTLLKTPTWAKLASISCMMMRSSLHLVCLRETTTFRWRSHLNVTTTTEPFGARKRTTRRRTSLETSCTSTASRGLTSRSSLASTGCASSTLQSRDHGSFISNLLRRLR